MNATRTQAGNPIWRAPRWWSQADIAAYCALASALGGNVTDPRYHPHPQLAEQRLRDAVRSLYRTAHRAHLVDWINGTNGYVERWKAAPAKPPGDSP